jgi:hypothetical protein
MRATFRKAGLIITMCLAMSFSINSLFAQVKCPVSVGVSVQYVGSPIVLPRSSGVLIREPIKDSSSGGSLLPVSGALEIKNLLITEQVTANVYDPATRMLLVTVVNRADLITTIQYPIAVDASTIKIVSSESQDCIPTVIDPGTVVTPIDAAPISDIDADLIADDRDACPRKFSSKKDHALVGLPLGCPCTDWADNDFDGLYNCQEIASERNVPIGIVCSDKDDADKDGTPNCDDPCPTDPNKTLPLECGCEVPETPTCNNACRGGLEDIGCGCGVLTCTTPSSGDILTEKTQITTPPVVELLGMEGDVKRDVKLTLRMFDGAALAVGVASFSTSAQKAKAKDQLSIRYDVRVSKIEGDKQKSVARRVVRSNSVLLRKLTSGLYTAKYRALIKSKEKRAGAKSWVAAKTGFSPAQTFAF